MLRNYYKQATHSRSKDFLYSYLVVFWRLNFCLRDNICSPWVGWKSSLSFNIWKISLFWLLIPFVIAPFFPSFIVFIYWVPPIKQGIYPLKRLPWNINQRYRWISVATHLFHWLIIVLHLGHFCYDFWVLNF